MLGLVGPWEKYVRDLHMLRFIGEIVLLPYKKTAAKIKMFLPTSVGASFHLKTYQCVQTLRYWRTWLGKCLIYLGQKNPAKVIPEKYIF